MPTYTVEAPGGIIFDLEGDSPPSEQELEQIFSTYSAQGSTPSPEMTPDERIQRQEHLAGITAGQAPIGVTETLAQGILNSLLAGTPEAIAVRSGVPLQEIEAIKAANPYTYSIGEALGAAVPLGAISRTATGLKSLVGQGARLGGIFGAGQGVSQEALRDEADIGQALETALTTGAAGATIGAALPLALGGAGTIASKLAPPLRASAEKNVAQTLLAGGGTKKNKAIVEKITPEILDRPFTKTFAMTRKGLETKSEAQREIAGEAIDAFGTLAGDVNPQQITSSLEKLKAPYTVEGVIIDPPAVDRIQAMQDIFLQLGDSIPTESLRTIRRTFDNDIKESKGFFTDLSQGSTIKLKKVASDGIRNILAEKEPDLAKLNKQYSFWANLNDVISATNERKKGQSGGFYSNVAAIGGAMTAGPGVTAMATKAIIFKYAVQAVQSPAWKLASAKIKNELAEALAINDPNKFSRVLSRIPGVNAADFKSELDSAEQSTVEDNPQP